MLFYCILHPTATRAVKMQSYKSYSVYSLFINNNFSPPAYLLHSFPVRTPFSRRPHHPVQYVEPFAVLSEICIGKR